MTRRTRRAVDIFNLSFLDVVSCGFGAIILLLVIVVAVEDPAKRDFWASTVAAPVFSEIAGAAVSILDIAPVAQGRDGDPRMARQRRTTAGGSA